MKIDVLTELLKQHKSPSAYAYVEFYQDKPTGKICVVYNSPGKVYTYKGSIYNVAERLGLIPEFNVCLESDRALSALSRGLDYVTSPACCDTIRHRGLDRGILLDYHDLICDHVGKDQYDRELMRFSLKSSN